MSNNEMHLSKKLGERTVYVVIKGYTAAIYIMKPDNWAAMRMSGMFVEPLWYGSANNLTSELYNKVCETSESCLEKIDNLFTNSCMEIRKL